MFSRTSIQKVLCCAVALFLGACGARADGTYIPIGNRMDILPDAPRHILYVTSGPNVLRYNWKTNAYETPFALSGTLKGLDISPDGKLLAVADNKRRDEIVGLYLIDLTTGTPRRIEWTRPKNSLEGGTFSVAFTASGKLLVTSSFEGSGWVPMRRIDPATGTVTDLGSNAFDEVRQDTMLCASGDRKIVAFAESNSSDGPFGTYTDATGEFERRDGYTNGTSAFNFEIGMNRDGSQMAIPTYMGTYVYNSTFAKIQTIGVYASGQPIGVAYNPTANIAYFPWADSKQVRAYNTDTGQQVGTFEAEATFDHTGNHAFQSGRTRVASDGSLLATTIPNGVRIWNLIDTPEPTATSVPSATATPLPTSTPVPTSTPLPVGTPVPTAIPSPTATPAPTRTPSPTPTPVVVPSISVKLSPTDPRTRDRLKATVTYNSKVKVTLRYEWFNGNRALPEKGANLDLLSPGYGDKDNTVTVKVTPFIGLVRGVVARASVKVQNTPPVLSGKTARTRAGTPIDIPLTVRDDDNDRLSFSVSVKPVGGTVTFSNKDGQYILRYSPRADWSGVETLKVRVSDTSRATAESVVSITVSPTPSTKSTGSGAIAQTRTRHPYA